MTEETTSKKQDFIVKLNEWRKKYSDCQISPEEIDAIFARDKEVFSTDIPKGFGEDD